MTGNSRANNLTIIAGLGAFNVLDSLEARTTVAGTLNVTGNLINLGTGFEDVTGIETDRLVFSGLTYNSRGNTNIDADSSFELRGDSDSDGVLILNSDGQITAGLDATFAANDGFTLSDFDDEFDFVISG